MPLVTPSAFGYQMRRIPAMLPSQDEPGPEESAADSAADNDAADDDLSESA